jgi:hypothetical protein
LASFRTCSETSQGDDQVLLIQSEEVHDPIAKALNQFWDTETFRISATEDQEVYDHLLDTNRFDDKVGRYEVKLPWRKRVTGICDNYKIAEKRLKAVHTKLQKDSELMVEYDNIMRTQLELGILEEVPADKPEPGQVYYMPHLPVVRRDKDSTKLRVVYDANSKTLGKSLNQCLHQGPCLLPQLFKVLLRFRMHSIGIVADIEKAFLNICGAGGSRFPEIDVDEGCEL